MITANDMLGVLAEMMPDPARLANDPSADATIDAESKRIMAEGGVDPDGVFAIGNTIMQVAVQSEAPPEDAVVGAFATGVALTIALHRKGLLLP